MPEQATESTIGDGRRSLAKAGVAAAVILLFLSCCAISFWPLGGVEGEDAPERVDRIRNPGAILVEDVSTRRAEGLDIGQKGTAIVVTCTLTSRRADVLFDPAFLRLQFDSVSLPPMARAAGEAASLVSYPSVLKVGVRETISALFATPRGSMEATFVVQFPDMDPSDAVAVKVVFEQAAMQ